MSTVDNRVVEMQFNNQHFENNVRTSLKTLDKLKQSLNLKGVGKGLESIDTASKKVNMSVLASSVDTVRMKFSALQVMAVTALTNITNSAINAGKRIVSALTIDPVKTGLSEYETQIGAVQTILSNTRSKGSTLDDVNRALDELNTYADKTIYNFTEMTRNIGTFTAAGVELDTAVNSIKGIANLAAVSGSTSQQASTAMYQLSQALAAGKVSLMDWNSVVNAGMGGEVFQQALIRTSERLGTGAKEAIEEYGTFRESLTQGEWLTTKVLTETLNQLAGVYSEAQLISQGYTEAQAKEIAALAADAESAATDVKTFTQLFDTLKESAQSGWTQTWETIIGDFDEAKKFMSQLSNFFGDIIGDSANQRNELLSGALSTGWKQLLDSGIPDIQAFKDEISSVAKTNSKSFNKMTEDGKSFEEALTKGLKDGSISAKDLTKSVSNLRKKIEGMSAEEQKAAGYTKDHVEALKKLDKGLKDGSISMDEFVNKMTRPSGRQLLIDALMHSLNEIKKVFGVIGDAWNKFFEPLTSEQLYKGIEKFSEFIQSLELTKEKADELRRVFEGLFAALDLSWTFMGGVVSVAFKTLKKVLGLTNADLLEMVAHVGDAIVAFRNWLTSNEAIVGAAEKVYGVISKVLEVISKFVEVLWETPIVQTALQAIGNAISWLGNTIDSFVSKGANKFIEFLDKLKGKEFSFDGIKSFFSNFGALIKDCFVDAQGKFHKFADILSNFRTKIGGYLEGLGEKFSGLKDKLSKFWDFIKSMIPSVLGLIAIVGMLKGLKSIGTILETVFMGPRAFLESMSGSFKKYGIFGELIAKAKAFDTTANGMLKIAGAIAILAGSLALLAYVDTHMLKDSKTGIWGLFGLIAALAGVLAVLAGGLGFLNKKFAFDIAAVGLGLIEMAGAITLLAVSLKIMDGIDSKKAINNVIIISLLAGALTLLAGLLSSKVSKISSGFMNILAIAAGAWLMADALKKIDDMDLKNAGKSIGVLMGFVVALGLLGKLCGGASFGSMIGLIAVVISLRLLIGTLEKIADVDFTKIKTSIKSFALIFGALAALMLISRLAGANAWKAGVGILGITSALFMLLLAVRIIGKMDESAVANATKTIAKLLLLFGAVVALSHFAGANAHKAALLLVAMAGAMLMMTLVIAILKNMRPEGLGQALGIITLLGVIIGGLMYITKFVPAKAMGTLIALTACVTVLAGVVIALSMIPDASKVAVGVAALFGIVGALSALMLVSKYVGSVNWLKTLGMLGVLTAVVLALGGILLLLRGLDGGNSLAIAGALSMLILAITGACTILRFSIGDIGGALVSIMVLTIVVAALGEILRSLQGLDPAASLGIAASLSLLILSLSGACVALAFAGTMGAAAFVGIGALATLIIAIGAIMATMGNWADDLGPKLEKGIGMMGQIGAGIGAFIGGIFGGIGTGFAIGMAQMGTALSKFMTNLQPFLEGVKSIDSGTAEGVENLASCILSLTKATILDGIGKCLTGGQTLGEFAKQLVPFGKAMKEFSAEVTGLDTEAVNAAANAGKMIAEMAAALPNSGGALGWIMGENDMSIIGKQLVPFGKAIKDFSAEVTGIDTKAVEAAANAGKMIAEMAAALPNEGGVWGWLAGENSMSQFVEHLVPFGTAIKQFSASVGNIDGATVTAAANAGKAIAEMASALPDSGGVWGWLAGDTTLEDMTRQLIPFGYAIADFAESVGSTTEIKDLAPFISNMGNFGKACKEFSDVIDDVKMDEGAVATAVSIGDMIAALGSAFSTKTPLNTQNMNYFMDNLEPMAVKFGGFCRALREIDVNNVGTPEFITLMDTLAPFASAVRGFYEVFNGFDLKNTDTINSAVEGIGIALQKLPNSGGWGGTIFGENDPLQFIGQLESFADSVVAFYGAFDDFDLKNTDTINAAVEGIGKALKKLPNSGGWAGAIAGENDPMMFVEQLEPFAESVKAFYKAFDGFELTDADTIANAVAGIAKAIKKLPNSGGWGGAMFGENDIAQFTDLGTFAKSVKDFYKAFDGFTLPDTTSINNAVEHIRVIVKKIPKLEGTGSVGSLSTTLPSLADAISGFFSTLSGIDTSTTNVEGIESGLSSLGKVQISGLIESLKTAVSQAKTVGNDFVNAMAEGISTNTNANTAGVLVAVNAAIGARETQPSFVSAGAYLGAGLVQGINSMVGAAYSAGYALGQAAVQGEMDGQASASPSKLTIKSGKWFGQGLIIGIDSMRKKVYKAGHAVGDVAVSSLSNSIAHISDVIDGNIDAQPTIRPVLDLSDVSAGAGLINGMFGMTPSVGLLSNVGSISTMMNRRQNGANGDVISAIKDLGKTLGSNNPGNTYNINGVTYDDGSNVADAIQTLVRAATVERRR